jgi:hypothetical protein
MERERTDSAFAKDQTGLTMDERLASLFQPDTLLSAQYFSNLRRKTLLEPEKRLLLAILEDAIQCFQNNLSAQTVIKKRLLDEAEEWIFKRGEDWIFSFDHVCEALGFTPEYVRQGLLRWKEKPRAKNLKAEAWDRKKLA